MRHDEQRALVVEQLLFQQLQRLHVEVVRGFVHHEQVRRFQEQPREQQARLLAARERLHGRPRALRREEEVLKVSEHVLLHAAHGDRVAVARHDLLHGRLGVELGVQLVEERHLHARPDCHRAGGGRERARQQFQERGLARAVLAHHADALALQDVRSEIGHNRMLRVVCKREVLDLDHAVAGRGRRVHPQRSRAGRHAPVRELESQLAQRLHAPLVALAARLHALADPRLLLRELLRLLLPESSFVRLQVGLSLEERAVVAIPAGEQAAVEVVDVGGDRLQERAVVRDEEERRLGLPPDERLQPLDRRDVEVVRRLVEEHEVGFVGQHAREQHAAAQAARERIEHGVGVEPHLRDESVGTGDLLDGSGAVRRNLLLKEGHFQTRRVDDLARVGFNLPGDDLQERGFSLPVAPGHARAYAALNIQRDPVQNGVPSKCKRNVVQGKKVTCHGPQACGRGGSL